MLALAKNERLPRGIVGVTGKRQVSVVVSNGRKTPGGGVAERDRFHIVEPTENKSKIKPYHPAFAAFNSAPVERRRSIYGILTHLHEDDAFWYERKAQQLPVNFYKTQGWFKNTREDQKTVAHPNRLPACCGGAADINGKIKARRWMGPDPDDFKIIDCPGERCEFAIKADKKNKPPCGPSLEFIFQIMWKDEFAHLPSVTARYTSHGWNTLEYFIGFFNEITTAIKALGIEQPVLYGFPFMMSLAEKTKPSEGWNWPVVTIAPMISPLDFFYAQTEKRKQLKEMAAQIPAVITVTEEMVQRPIVYLMDEVGPIRIGNSSTNGATVVTVEHEILSEDVSKHSEPEKVTHSKPQVAKTGIVEPILLYPENWKEQKEWRGIPWKDLQKKIAGNELDKEFAVHECRFRIVAFEDVFKKLGAHDEWKNLTVGGEIEKIPILPIKGDEEKVCLAGVVGKLTERWKKLDEAKKRKAA